jgi:uncharacterized membrane protein
MKKYFVTGLVILLPVTITIAFIAFIFNLLTAPFHDFTKAILENFGLGSNGFLFLNASQFQNLLSKIFIIISLFFFTILLGFLGNKYFFNAFINFWEHIVHKIPLVNSIYKACQDIITTIFGSKSSAFKQVVMVPFPNAETHTLGFVTRDNMPNLKNATGPDLIAVFIPTTPNPTSGFLTIFKKEDVMPLDMSVEDAFKYIISCGVIMTPFKAAKNDNNVCPNKENTIEEHL